jgi:hypothetical protein
LHQPDLSDYDRRGLFILAGFIADGSLATSVKTAWDRAKDKANVLLPAIGPAFAARKPILQVFSME